MKMSEGLLSRLYKLRARYEELGGMLARPEVVSDQSAFKALSKEHSELQPAAEKFEGYLAHKRDLEECEKLLAAEGDHDMRDMLKEELKALADAMDRDTDELRGLRETDDVFRRTMDPSRVDVLLAGWHDAVRRVL